MIQKTLSIVVSALCGIILASLIFNHSTSTNKKIALWELMDDGFTTTFQEEYESKVENEPSLETLQSPIPREDRVRNYTGVQCVYSSIEMLGRWAEEPKLINPPITSRPDCKSYSNPSQAAKILRSMDVKFEQTYGDKNAGLRLIKKAMREGRGCLWSIRGHAMVLVHYSEEEDKVCWVDNSDRTLKVQQTTINGFNRIWTSWVLVIYADDDIIQSKLFNAFNMPIIDQLNMSPNQYPKYYLPIPKRRDDD